MRNNNINTREADEIFYSLREHPEVARMKNYIQHGDINTFQHCEAVVNCGRKLNQVLHIHADEISLIRGGMLHDFYLYDWHIPDKSHKLHGFSHPRQALNNALKYFNLNKREKNIILSHMWPLTVTQIPTSREAWLICLADKYCALRETFHRGHKNHDKMPVKN